MLWSLISRVLRKAARLCVRLYYPRIEITDSGNIPAGGPLLVVANHPNSLIDPVMIGIVLGRPVRFLAKAPLFEEPFFGSILRALGMMPAYRGSDDRTQVKRNVKTLHSAAESLIRGETIGLFPEGKSHDAPRLEMVRSGAARIAMEAHEGGAKELKILPIGINYEKKERFGGRVWIKVGQALDVETWVKTNELESRQAIRQLSEEISRALKQLVVHVNDPRLEIFLDDLEKLVPAVLPASLEDPNPLHLRKRIADSMNAIQEVNPREAERVAELILTHRTHLEAEGLTMGAAGVRFSGIRMLIHAARVLVRFAAAVVPAVVGSLFHILPFTLVRRLAARNPQPTQTTVATHRLGFGIPIYSLWYASWAAASGYFFPWITLLVVSLMPLCGVIALQFWRRTFPDAVHLWNEMRVRSWRGTLSELRSEREQIGKELNDLLRQSASTPRQPETDVEVFLFPPYFERRIRFTRSELVKYAIASLCVLLPCVGRLFHYWTPSCLATFLAFYCLSFGVLVWWRVPRTWMVPLMALGVGGLAYQMAIGKPLGYQTLTAMYETNYREMLGFLSSPYSIPLLLGATAGLALLLKIIVSEKPLPFLHAETFVRRKYLFPALALSGVLFSLTNWSVFETYPLCLFYENFMYINENVATSSYLSAPYQCPPEHLKEATRDETYVLIIGEAARRASLSAYGYARKTTPMLDDLVARHPDNVALFTDAISTAAFTKASVMSMYSPLTHREELSAVHSKPGLTKIFKGSGARTLYITSRPKYRTKNMLSTFLDDAEQTIYLTSLTRKRFDEEAIPMIRDFIEKAPGKRFIVWHLLGSHIEYSSQYPESQRFFASGQRMLDSYDDSIRYTDHVIHRLMAYLLERDHPVVALYVPDHGENLNDSGDNNYGHGTKALTSYELKVPFVFYFNDSYIAKHPEAATLLRSRCQSPICHDHVAHTFMGLAGITDPFVYRRSWDISSADFENNTRWVTDENMRLFDYATVDFSRKSKLENVKNLLPEKYRSKFTW